MAPLASPDDASQNPTAQVAEFTAAQQTARLAALREGTVNFAVAPRIAARAQNAEQGLDAGSQFAAESQRRRIEAGVGLPLNFPTAPEDNPEAELGMQEAQNEWEANMEESRQEEDYGNPRFGSIAENVRNQAESLLDSPAISEALDAGIEKVWAAVFQGSADIDSTAMDGAITYAFGATGTAYQTVLTLEVFPQLNELEKNSFGRYLPRKFKKTIFGWGQRANAILILIWGPIILTVIFALIMIIAAPLLGLTDFLGIIDFGFSSSDFTATPSTAQPTP